MIGLPSPHPKEGHLVYPGLKMGLLRVLAHETLRMDSEKRICLKEEALSGEAEHLGKKISPFSSHLPQSTTLLYFHGFFCLSLANEVVTLLVSEDLENQI